MPPDLAPDPMDDRAAGDPSGGNRPPTVAVLDADIRFSVPARPETVPVIRHVLGALADALGLPDALREDVRLAVTEACTNVVRHAYGGGEGAMEVIVRPGAHGVDVIVCDHGLGHGGSVDMAGPGLGLALIDAVTASARLEQAPGQGSRLTMTFPRARAEADAP